MRSVSALDVRKHFGRLLDEAAAGERLIIERAGQPVAALVPLSDLAQADPDRRRAERLKAIDDIARLAKRYPRPPGFDPVEAIREQRRLRDEQIMRAVHSGRSSDTPK
jgi:prevent-host-death family protein